LPSRIITVRSLNFNPQEKMCYDQLMSFTVNSFRELAKEGDKAVMKNYAHILELLLRLRQSCDHPLLVKDSKSLINAPEESEEFARLTSALQTRKESTKISALMQELYELYSVKDNAPVKCIVFSQWTSMLDLIEPALKLRNYKFVRLDGSMSQQEREKMICTFNTDPATRVFLISVKAGGLGLNLTAASRVFLLDPWWNPAIEDQAIDRVHRIGQTREVVVTRFIIRDSVEERILRLQDKKRQLADGALCVTISESDRKALRLEELRMLLNLDPQA